MMMLVCLVLLSITGCEYKGEEEWYEIRISEPGQVLKETRLRYASGNDNLGALITTDDTSPVTIFLRQAEEYQLFTIKADRIHKDAGFRTGSISDSEGDLIARAVWVISVPVEARMELHLDPEKEPGELRVLLDTDGDGVTDTEIEPRIAVTGEALDPSNIIWKVNRASTVEPTGDGQARVTLDYPRDIRGSLAGPLHEIVYAVYPDQPELQIYEGPFLAELGSTVQYRIIFQDGGVAEVPSLSIE